MLKQLILILVAGVMTGCTHSAAATRAPPSTPPADSRRKAPSRPKIEMVQLQQEQKEKVYRGWPLLVAVRMSVPMGWRIAYPGPGSRYLRLNAESGALDSLLKLRLSAVRPVEGEWPLAPAVLPRGARVQEFPSGERWLEWYLSAEETRGLAPGEYALSIGMEPSHGPRREAASEWMDSWPRHFEVVDEPSPLSAPLRESKALRFAQYEVDRGDRNAALAILDAHLKEQPGSVGAWCFKAELAEQTGDLERALSLYEECLGAFYSQEPRPYEAPFALIWRIDALRDHLGKKLLRKP